MSCNTNQQQMQTDSNPFFAEYGTPFHVPPFDVISNEHFMPAFKAGMKQQSEAVEAIADNPEAAYFRKYPCCHGPKWQVVNQSEQCVFQFVIGQHQRFHSGHQQGSCPSVVSSPGQH